LTNVAISLLYRRENTLLY